MLICLDLLILVAVICTRPIVVTTICCSVLSICLHFLQLPYLIDGDLRITQSNAVSALLTCDMTSILSSLSDSALHCQKT